MMSSRQSSINGEDWPLLGNRRPEGQRLWPISLTESTRAALVLPLIIVSYFAGYIATLLQLNPYIYDRVSEEYPEFHADSKKPCVEHMNESYFNKSGVKIQEEIEKQVATIELYLGLTSFTIAVIPILFLGPITDTYGRCIGFIFPILGTLCKTVSYVVIISKRLSYYWFFLGHTMEALGGSFAAMLMLMFSVTSDITSSESQRSFRMTLMEGLYVISASIVQVGVAQWMKIDQTPPLWFAIGTSGLAIVFLKFLPETSPAALFRNRLEELQTRGDEQQTQDSSICGFIKRCITMVLGSFVVYFRDDQGRLAKRWLCFLAFTLTIAVNLSKPNVLTLFLMKYPLCWGNTLVYTFNGVVMAIHWLIIWIVLFVLHRVFHISDRIIIFLGCLSSIASLLVLSFAYTDVFIYLFAVAGTFTRVIIPILRSLMGSLISSERQGTIFTGLACMETLGAGVMSLASNRIYYASLNFWAGTVFVVLAALMFIVFGIMIAFNMLHNADERRRQNQLNVQEGHS